LFLSKQNVFRPAAVSALLVAAGCVQQEYGLPPGDCRFLISLRVENAEFDANAAVIAKDFRLLGVYGYALEVPGLYFYDYYTALDRGELRTIECTGDGIVSPRHERLNDNAYEYAKRYNTVVLREMPQPPERLPLPPTEPGPNSP
jgi:hypothetical protein